MKTLKDHIQTYARPEASMAEGNVMSKTLAYCTEYIQCFQGTFRHVWDDKEEQIMNDKVIQRSGWWQLMLVELRDWVYNFIINNFEVLNKWRI